MAPPTPKEVIKSFSNLKSEYQAAKLAKKLVGKDLIIVETGIQRVTAMIEEATSSTVSSDSSTNMMPWLFLPFRMSEGQTQGASNTALWTTTMEHIARLSLIISESYRKSVLSGLGNIPTTGEFLEPNAGLSLFHPWYDRIRPLLKSVIESNSKSLAEFEAPQLDRILHLYTSVQASNQIIEDIARYLGERPYVASELDDILSKSMDTCELQEKIIASFLKHGDDALVRPQIADSCLRIETIVKEFQAFKEKQMQREKDLEAFARDSPKFQTHRIPTGLKVHPGTLEGRALGKMLMSEPWSIKVFSGDYQLAAVATNKRRSPVRVARVVSGDHVYAVKDFKSQKTALQDWRICVRIIREVAAHRTLEHENVLPFEGIWATDEDYPAIVTRWCEGGDLWHYVAQGKASLGEKLRYALEVAEGLGYLHNRDPPMIHADVKAENVLLRDGHALLGDFGHARHKSQARGFTTDGKSYTEGWRAPELTLANESQSKLPAVLKYQNTMTDVYAFACMLLEVITEDHPMKSALRPHGQVVSTSGSFGANHLPEEDVVTKTPVDITRTNPIVYRVYYDIELDLARSSEFDPKNLPIVNKHWDFMKKCWDRSPWARPKADEVVKGLGELCEDEKEFQVGRSDP